jgi:hypothetical protein
MLLERTWEFQAGGFLRPVHAVSHVSFVYNQGGSWWGRSKTASKGKYQVECGTAFETVIRGGLVVGPDMDG